MRLERVLFQLAKAVGGDNVHVVGRCDVRLAVKLRGDEAGPDDGIVPLQLHLEFPRVRCVEFREFLVDLAFGIQLQRRTVDAV